MSYLKITHKKSNKTVCQKAVIASSIFQRLMGLMFKSNLSSMNGDGLLIDPCNSIHTCFMRFNIDVIFISKENKVVKIIRNLKPWRITWIYFKAKKVLEINGEHLNSFNIDVGDELVEESCIN